MTAVDIAAGSTRATLVPELGMIASSWRHAGHELLAFPATLDAYADTGAATAAALLFPWANRLDGLAYAVDGRRVELASHRQLVQFDGPLPIHGVLPRLLEMTVIDRREDEVTAAFEPDVRHPVLAVYPFSHRLTVRAAVGEGSLTVETSVAATGDVPVPVSFGYHPYVALPSGARDDWTLSTSATQHLVTDDRLIPTGKLEPVDLSNVPLRDRSFDDGYTELGARGTMAIAGDGTRIAVRLEQGYTHAQIYAPPGRRFVALEPMTAPTNALVTGTGLRRVAPGEQLAARFTMAID